MAASQNFDINNIIFREERVSSHINLRFQELLDAGYQGIGKHVLQETYLFRSEQNYLILSLSNDINTPPAIGIIVEDAESVLTNLFNKGFDIFDGGRVGSLSLHIPAFRNTEGQIIYLINQIRAKNFYASDFTAEEGYHA